MDTPEPQANMSPGAAGMARLAQRDAADRDPGLLPPALLCLGLAAFSIWRQGFSFGIVNNVFHVPIVLRWWELPQFQNDAMVQSLAYFTAPIYWLLGLVLTEDTIEAGFLVMHAVTRVLTFAALYALAGAVGLREFRVRALALLIIACVTASYGLTALGKTGLLIGYFSHSELAQAVSIFAVLAGLRGRLDIAGALAGVAFLLNAFFGVWLALPIGLLALHQLAVLPDRRRTIRRCAIGAAGFALGALPILVWVAASPPGTVDIDYHAFLADFFPQHFIFAWGDLRTQLRVAILLGLACVASACLLPREGRGPAFFLMGCFAAIFAAGIVVGDMVTSRMVLNLHLLRVDGLLTLLALTIVAGALAQAFLAGRPVSTLFALAVVVALQRPWNVPAMAVSSTGFLLALAIESRFPGMVATRPLPRSVMLPAALAGLALANWLLWFDEGGVRRAAANEPPHDTQLFGARPDVAEWAETKAWIRGHTPADAVFLVPTSFYDFRIGTQRSSWVDWKHGSAVMWAPDLYPAWRQRIDEVTVLATPTALMDYARRNGIAYVVIDKRRMRLSGDDRPVFENRWFAVLPTPP